MKLFRIVLLLFLAAALPPAARSEDGQEVNEQAGFYLIPLLEAAFSGELAWRPDWPAGIPPDAFSLSIAEKIPLSITLSSDTENLNFIRDTEGRLVEFFMPAPQPGPQTGAGTQGLGYVKAEAGYADSGAILSLNITAQTVWNIEFPADFFPFSEISPGGAFPPVKVSNDNAVFFVFIFESPEFLTETWYDENGNFLAFLKAFVIREKGDWRIRSMQFREMAAYYEEERFYESGGNISEIRSGTEVFSAFYRDKRPEFWQRLQNFSYDLHWDTQGRLTWAKNTVNRQNFNLPAEYRYEYETDASGNWTKRYEIPIIRVLDVFAPQPPAVEKVWRRKIVFLEN